MVQCDQHWFIHVFFGSLTLLLLFFFAVGIAEMWCYIVEVRHDIKRIKQWSTR